MEIRKKLNSCSGCNSYSSLRFRNRKLNYPINEDYLQTCPISGAKITQSEYNINDDIRKITNDMSVSSILMKEIFRNNRRIGLKKSAVPSIFPFVMCHETKTKYRALTKKFRAVETDENVHSPINKIYRYRIRQLTRRIVDHYRNRTTDFNIEDNNQSAIPDEYDVDEDDAEEDNADEDNADKDNADEDDAMAGSKLPIRSSGQRLISHNRIYEILMEGEFGNMNNSYNFANAIIKKKFKSKEKVADPLINLRKGKSNFMYLSNENKN